VRLAFITQRIDVDDPALGATVAKVRALAPLVDELVVLALDARPTELPPNVRIRTFGGGSRAGRTLRLLAALFHERPTAVVAHMAPIYAVLAAVVTRPRRAPLLLWFTHWRRSRLLQVAERVSTRVLSVDERSFPLPSKKLVAVGHGITVGPPLPPRPDDGAFRLVAVGRTSPAKGLEALATATERVPGATLLVVGPSLTGEELRHRDQLLARGVQVEPAVPHARIREVYATADVLVNNMRAGALDKVVFEAAAAGLPVLVASHGFDPLVGGIEPPLRFEQDDPSSIASRIEGIAAIGSEERRAIGAELRARVERDHSVERWAERVVEAAR
jgi:glycosyltransferase involved in cell wall biosynthesis